MSLHQRMQKIPSSGENPQQPSALEQQDSALPQWGGERHAPTAKIRQDKHPDLLPPTSQITPNWEQRDHIGNQGNTKEDR